MFSSPRLPVNTTIWFPVKSLVIRLINGVKRTQVFINITRRTGRSYLGQNRVPSNVRAVNSRVPLLNVERNRVMTIVPTFPDYNEAPARIDLSTAPPCPAHLVP